MPETQTRGWHTRSAERAGRVLEKCRRRKAASVSDVEDLRNVTTRMAAEIDRLHGVIRAKEERLRVVVPNIGYCDNCGKAGHLHPHVPSMQVCDACDPDYAENATTGATA